MKRSALITEASDFSGFGLKPQVLRAIEALGFEEPTPVQSEVIPRLLAGKDVIVQAQTGSGKTAAYGIPIVESVDPRRSSVQALVLSPTRELALQVSVHLNQLGRFKKIGVVPVYGGQSYSHQFRALRQGAHVIVATPGRLLDLMERKAVVLEMVRLVVLDEADEMLDMGFLEDVEKILSQAPAERQTALFSATIPKDIIRLAEKYLRKPEQVTLSLPRARTVPTVRQSYYVVPSIFKIEAVTRLLDMASPELALVFCATKQMTADLARELQSRGYQTKALHGDISQKEREKVMEESRAGRVEVLVATDVAARGLDIPEVSHVFNFDMPQGPDRYIHRIGRTARAGRAGEAVTLVLPRETQFLRGIERAIGVHIERKELPTVAQMEEKERADLAAKVEHLLQDQEVDGFRSLVESLAERHDPLDIAVAALSHAFGPAKRRAEIPRVALKEVSSRKPGRALRKGAARSQAKYRDKYDRRKKT